MRVFRELREAAGQFAPAAITIGNFDGVHAGHRKILRRVAALAHEHGWRPSVLTFDPHPASVVAPERAPRLLTTPAHRAELMAEEAIEQVLILPFNAELARLQPEEFVRDLLVGTLGARAVLVGDNFRFGFGQAGTVESLKRLGAGHGVAVEIVPAVEWRGRTVSSTAVRELLRAGDVVRAGRMLERFYSLTGEVVSGRGVGHVQTVPTMNLRTECEVIPATGVYVTRTFDAAGGRAWRSVTNIGYRPTFGASDELTIETFLLDPFVPPTPESIRVEFLHRLRGERKFASPEELKRQIGTDVGRTLAWFRRAEHWRPRAN